MLKYKITTDLREACEIAPRPVNGHIHVGTIEAKHFKKSALVKCEYTGYYSRVDPKGIVIPVSSFLVDNELKRLGYKAPELIAVTTPARVIINFNRRK